MITSEERSDSDGADRDLTLRMADHEGAARSAGDAGRVLDGYAEAELQRRHERTESIIRKAHEQFT